MYVYETPITDIDSLLKGISFANEKFKGQVWWRGQRAYEWDLRPSIFRKSNDGYEEQSGILRFQQKAVSRHSDIPPMSDMSAWLFLMQHYRLPTRLLDWTEAPLVAAYFGCEVDECHRCHPECIADADGALFALSPYLLNRFQIKRNELLMPEEKEALDAMAPAFNDGKAEASHVVAVRPSEVDIRLMVQLSVFTLNGFDTSIDGLEKSDDFTIKYKIPASVKSELISKLKQLGVRLSNIFPDLEHLAEEIRQLKFRPRAKVKPSVGSAPQPDSFDRGGEGST